MKYFTVPDVPGFLVGRELGRGGSSTVWLVTEERTGRNFALKCLGTQVQVRGSVRGLGAEAPDALGEEAIRREIRILSVLDHQHLIKAHDAFRFDWPVGPAGSGGGGMGLLLDYAPGGSLGELVGSRGKLTIGETVTVLTPIAQVLGYLHGRGFTHGDVSPGNVLFTAHGKPMLSDVGIARMVGDASSVPDHGTAGFMDPSPVDAVRVGLQPERDVYSVAALGWYCLTGEPPRRTADRPPLSLLLPDVPADLAAVLEAGLNEDRRLRPTAVELATAVYRSASPLPVDLASSVHSTIMPQLLTRRSVPDHTVGGVCNGFRAWRRRISTSRWSGLMGARQVLPFPQEEQAIAPVPRAPGPNLTAGPEQADEAEKRGPRGKHALDPAHGQQTADIGPQRRAAAPGAHPQAAAPGRDRSGGRAPDPIRTTGRRRGTMLLAAGAGAVVAGAIWTAGAFGQGGPWAGPFESGVLGVTFGTAGGGGPAGSNGSSDSTSGPAGPLAPAAVTAQLDSTDPLEAVRGLATLRSLAFSSGQLELLDLVNAPGSAASAMDTRIKGQLEASGHVLAGFASTVSDLRLQPGSTSGRAVVGVTSATSSYEEKDSSGAVVAVAAPGSDQKLRLVLVSVDGRWRITDVLPGS